MKQLKRPTSVRIMGRDYTIVYEDDSILGTENLGRTYSNLCVIGVKVDQHPVEEADTLIHEILHAIWYCMSISEGGADEEAVVRRMASGLLQVFMDNPDLLAYLTNVRKLISQDGLREVIKNKRGVSRPHGQRPRCGGCRKGKLQQGKRVD